MLLLNMSCAAFTTLVYISNLFVSLLLFICQLYRIDILSFTLAKVQNILYLRKCYLFLN